MLQVQIKEETNCFLCGQTQRPLLFNLSKFYLCNRQVQNQGQLFKSNSHICFLLWCMSKILSPRFKNHPTTCRQMKSFQCSLLFPKLPTDRWKRYRQAYLFLLWVHLQSHSMEKSLQRTAKDYNCAFLCKIRCSWVWWRRQRNKAQRFWFIQNLVWLHVQGSRVTLRAVTLTPDFNMLPEM